MIHATQSFNGVMFITNPSVPRAFIRVDVLERRYADTIKAISESASDRCGQHFELYELGLLSSLREQYTALTFPHDQLFKREAERQGFLLDNEHYRAVQEAASNLWEDIYEDMI
ncbi:hypothetical protein [Pseudomonas sp. NMS19W]|uniref:hypothetical protein n=1 Tax=Pseudomonas sp. NMS19W TaxID=3079768 RepID=UPI003F65DD37